MNREYAPPIRFGSVCSGIEAASVAWHPLGWRAAWLCEIEKNPSAVLAHHYPDVPNLGDMTLLPERIRSGEIDAPDVFCGGTPCQAFSVAGNRKSLGDARGNLSLTFCEIANAIDATRAIRGEQPCVIFWENVPGCLNTKDNFFGCFLAELAGEDVPLEPPGGKWTDAGCVLGPQRAVAWRVLDAQFFGLAQRRKRVFIISSSREGFDPAKVLLEFSGMRRDTPPRRPTREEIAADAAGGAGAAGAEWVGVDVAGTLDTECGGGKLTHQSVVNGHIIPCFWDGSQTAATLTVQNAGGGQRMPDKGNLGAVVVPVCADLSPTVTNGPPFSRTGNERVECDALVAVAFHAEAQSDQLPSSSKDTSISDPLTCSQHAAVAVISPPHAFKIRGGCEGGGKGYLGQDEQAFTITTGHDQQVAVPLAFAQNQLGEVRASAEVFNTLNTNSNASGRNTAMVATQYAVRRLTPVECERLQGFPDGYTNIPRGNKPESPDGPRYKALGNSWAVPVVRWIGQRIDAALRGDDLPW